MSILQDDALQQIKLLVPRIDWSIALRVWSMFVDFPFTVAVPKPVVATTSEEKKSVQFDEKLQSAAEELNMMYAAPESHETYTEKFCDYSSEDMHVQNRMVGIEAMSCDENCTVEEGAAVSYLKIDTNKCGDKSDREVLVGHDDIGDKSEVSKNEASALSKKTSLPSFRATCHRTGNNHCFQSPAAAAHFGGALHDYFGWNVDLNNYDIEVVLCIEDRDIRVGISLTNQSLHRRHITHFGKTTLRPTIAHGMLR